MAKPEFHHSNLRHISRRSILPLLPSDPAHSQKPDIALPDPSNVQGDIYLLFPKDHENFIFFAIRDAAQFKKDLASYDPTTSEDVLENLRQITQAKADANHTTNVKRVALWQTQLALSRSGLDLLGNTEKIKDVHFDSGSMRNEMKALGDSGPWDDLFSKNTIHGVFIVAASHSDQCQTGTQIIKDMFKRSTTDVVEIDGNARPGAERGHEHFGFKDAVSQPALRGLIKPHKGQLQADPGVVIMGYKGDSVFDSPDDQQRPGWTKDGTIMVFRKLEQDVLGFNDYLKQYGPKWREFLPKREVSEIKPPLTDEEGAALFGARLVGRWKSGAPLANAPYRDNPSLALDKEKVNNFDYRVKGQVGPSDRFCPFTAHTRKTAPRNLDPYIQQKLLESALIVRAGLPFGPEVSPYEKRDPLRSPRGLLFLCYQSSVEQGFWQQTKAFAGNDYFPMTSFVPEKHGQDPIIGGPGPDPVIVKAKGKITGGEITLLVEDSSGETTTVEGFTVTPNASATAVKPDYFVTSRGGEYFFVPSVSTLRTLAGVSPLKPFQSNPPTSTGVYRIKLLEHNPDLYWELIPGGNPWVKLCELDTSSDKQKWIITPLGNGQYHITSVFDKSGLVNAQYGYWGYGYPIPDLRGSDTWIMREKTVKNKTFLKIKLQNSPNQLDSYNNEVVHFYKDNDNAENQRWLLGPV